MTTKIPAELWARVDAVRGRLSRRQWIELTVEQDEKRLQAFHFHASDEPRERRPSPAAEANDLRAAKARADTERAGADLVARLAAGVLTSARANPRLAGVPDRAYARAWEALAREGALLWTGAGWTLAGEPSEPGRRL